MGINNIEHEIQVKYTDGILAHVQEWQWFINIVQEQFEICDVKSWEEYIKGSPNIQRVCSYFVKILEVCDKDWKFSKKEFQEIWQIAKFFLGQASVDDCKEELELNVSRILFFCVWLVKLENSDNNTSCLYDIRLLSQKNYFQLIKCDSIVENKENLMAYVKEIPVHGLEKPIQYLLDNLNRKECPCDVSFLTSHKDEILNYNAFFFRSVNKDECKTWQEVFLLDMLTVSFQDKKVIPLILYENGDTTPDLSLWTEDMLCELKKYFHHPSASFVIESINYVLHGNEPSKEVKLQHCKFLSEKLNLEESIRILSHSSSYQILSYLFQDKMLDDCRREPQYLEFLESIHSLKDPKYIFCLEEDGFPINKAQKNILNDFLENQFKEIDNVHTLNELLSYLRKTTIAKRINAEHLQKVHEKFIEQTTDRSDVLVASLYYEYMRFLFCVCNSNSNADKKCIQREMINIQETWQGDVYGRVFKSIQAVSYEQKFSAEEVEYISQVALLDPIIFANICMPYSEEEILKIMMAASENPLPYKVSKVMLAPEFPVMKEEIILERHDIDKLFFDYIQTLQKEKRHKFLNNLETKKFIEAIYDRYNMQTRKTVALFIKEEELYNRVDEATQINLAPYSADVSLAMITQLFPVLEMKIRELVKLFDVFPFKEEGFMKASSPAGLLSTLIGMVYKEQKSFENIADLLFVYNAMYNVNSCNVRNECIHGRNYLYGSGLNFALRVTLFSIYMVEFRIKTLMDNVSDIHETA